MNKLALNLFMLIMLCVIIMGCGGQTIQINKNQSVELTVSAAASLKDALTEIQSNYQAQQPNVKISYNLGGSGSLQKQIEQGAPVDIFISAANRQMDDLEKQNLIKKETRKNLVENQLVLVVPQKSTLQLTKFEDLTMSEVKHFAMGAPESVPAGQYTQQVLKNLNLYDVVQPKAVLTKDVRTVLTYVEAGNVEAGAVYKTDAAASDKVKVVAAAPIGNHEPIVYSVAVLVATKQAKVAEAFTAYLSSSESKVVFEKYGFIMSK